MIRSYIQVILESLSKIIQFNFEGSRMYKLLVLKQMAAVNLEWI
jgi:hypothetical protein